MGSSKAESGWFLKRGGEQKYHDRWRSRRQVLIGKFTVVCKTRISVNEVRGFLKSVSLADSDRCYVWAYFFGKGAY